MSKADSSREQDHGEGVPASNRGRLVGTIAVLLVLVFYSLMSLALEFASTGRESWRPSLRNTQNVWPPISGGDSPYPTSEAEHEQQLSLQWPESWGEFIAVNEEAKLPNQNRDADSTRKRDQHGTLSPHYGDIQRERQLWLKLKAEQLRSGSGNAVAEGGSEDSSGIGNDAESASQAALAADGDDAGQASDRGDADSKGPSEATAARHEALPGAGGAVGGGTESLNATGKSRLLDESPAAAAAAAETSQRTGKQYGEEVVVFPPLSATSSAQQSAAQCMAQRGRGHLASRRRLGDDSAGRQYLRALSEEAGGDGSEPSLAERIMRVEQGMNLWGATYVPPIEPSKRQQLVNKWSGVYSSGAGDGESDAAKAGEQEAGRILYVVSSIDRGRRLGMAFKDVDKLDYILMMMDEMREACEAGFSPHMHLITAWNPSDVRVLAADRLCCERTGLYVPFSYEEHPPSIKNLLSIKHRIYMKSRLENFDMFLQLEDDMMITLNHIMLYQEESELLENRRGPKDKRKDYQHVPGFIRIEPGQGGGRMGVGEDWFEWEILLSRFHPLQLTGAGTYMGLGNSKVLKGGNNQGMWMATREQLRRLSENCAYLNFDENTQKGHVETHSGSIQMFSPPCKLLKVFPATHFEDFLVHHRTNNKNGRRGESIPAVPVSMLRVWSEQYVRDRPFLYVQSRRLAQTRKR